MIRANLVFALVLDQCRPNETTAGASIGNGVSSLDAVRAVNADSRFVPLLLPAKRGIQEGPRLCSSSLGARAALAPTIHSLPRRL